jgi:hypothetical protein
MKKKYINFLSDYVARYVLAQEDKLFVKGKAVPLQAWTGP